jgi:hypothetical protein
VPPLLVALGGAAIAGGGAYLVTQTDNDDLGWAAAGAGVTLALTGLVWLLARD